MFRKFALLAAVAAAVASPAAAADYASIRISLAGKDRAAVEAEVKAAAETACRQVFVADGYERVGACIETSSAAALAQLKAAPRQTSM